MTDARFSPLTTVAPTPRTDSPAAIWWVVIAAALAVVSYLLARGIALGPASGPWAYWPMNGLLLGILYRRPMREWPALVIAAVVAQVGVIGLVRGDLANGATPIGAVGGAVQGMAGAWVLCRFGSKDRPLGGPRELFLFVAFAVCLIPLAVSPITAFAFSRGIGLPVYQTWMPLFVGNSLGILLFAPLVVADWARTPSREVVSGSTEIVLCQGSILLVTLVTFLASPPWLRYVALPHALFSLLAWSALRCGSRWTASIVVVVSTIAAWATARGRGPFADPGLPLNDQVLALQLYLAFAGLSSLLLSALTRQRRIAFREISLQHAVQSAFFDSSSAMIAMKDLHGRYLRVNLAFETSLGMRSETLVGRSARDLLPEADAAVVERHDGQVLELGAPLTFDETLMVHGGPRTMVTTRFPVRDADGAISYLGMIAQDETEERALAERLERAQRVELIGQLAAGLAHDLNNILTVIVGNADILRAAPTLDAAEQAMVRDMLVAGERATALTGRLLALGRRRPRDVEAVDVDALLGDLTPLLRALARGNIDVPISLAAKGARVHIDPVELEQILLNLVSNGRDAIGPAGGRIEVSTSVRPGTPRELVLRVCDTGRGMDEQTRARLFEPLFTTKAAAGTGLGLFTTAVLVKQANGRIAVTSEPGAGTTFVVELPCVEE